MTENETSRRYKLKEVCIRLAEGHPLYSDVPLSSPGAALHKEVFETEEGKAILRDLGIDDTKYVGIGNCILGYVDGDYPEAAPRKENYIYWIK